MQNLSLRRCLATGMIGALVVMLFALDSGAVAAAGNGCYATGLNSASNVSCTPTVPINYAYVGYPSSAPGYVYANIPSYAPGYTYANVPPYAASYVYPGVPTYASYAPAYAPAYGYTQAGPIVGFDGNGSALVYDVAGGTIDPYTIGPNGKYCEADTTGKCAP